MEASIRRRVEEDLRNHKKYQLELKELLNEIATENSSNALGISYGKGEISDPTSTAVIRYYSHARVKFLTHICDTITRCLFCLDKDAEIAYCKQRLIELLYFKNTNTVTSVAMELCYTERTIYRWKAELLEKIALELGYFI